MNTLRFNTFAKGVVLAAGLLIGTVASATNYVYRVPAKDLKGSFSFALAAASVPSGPPFIVQAALGQMTAMLLAQDGRIFASGGVMADGTGVSAKTFKQVPVTDKFLAVSAGRDHILALKNDGTLWGSGKNDFGQLGLGSSVNAVNGLVQLPGITDVVSVVAGDTYSMVLKSDGTIWGTGAGGMMGGFAFHLASPAGKVFTRIGGMWRTNYAIEADGTTWAMGSDDFGQAADGGSGNNRWVGWTQVGGSDKFLVARAGFNHALAIRADGTLWGAGVNSRLGFGPSGITTTLTQTAVGQTFSDVAPGANHSVALNTDGTIWGSGQGQYGQLGDGLATDRSVFAQSTTDKFTSIAGGPWGTFALKSDGTVWFAGSNNAGETGLNSGWGAQYNTFTQVPLPTGP